jgi:cell wall assembly regulator SMI1
VSEPVLLAWARFERALASLGLENVALAGGATPAALAAFETATELALPAAVRAFFTGHDGQTSSSAGLAGGFYFVSLGEAQKLIADWSTVRAKLGEGAKDLDRGSTSHPPKAIQRKYSLPGWVPLLRDQEGNAIGVDLEPGPAGAIGQVINFGRDEDDKYVLFPSVAELLDWLASELEAHRIVYEPEERRMHHVDGRITGVMSAR